MNVYVYALCWALAIMGLAVLNVFEVIGDGAAQTLFTTLPIIAVLSINACVRRKAA
jgi:hypothetical protein